MTFSYLHLKLPWSGGIYPNPTVKQSSRNKHKERNRRRTRKRKEEWHERDIAREREKREGTEEGRTGTICQSDAQSFGVHGVTRKTEPSVEATCLIMGNVCIWGRLWLAHPQHGQGKKAHWQLLMHYVSKLYTMHAYILHLETEN